MEISRFYFDRLRKRLDFFVCLEAETEEEEEEEKEEKIVVKECDENS
jgi:hypothetical protein